MTEPMLKIEGLKTHFFTEAGIVKVFGLVGVPGPRDEYGQLPGIQMVDRARHRPAA